MKTSSCQMEIYWCKETVGQGLGKIIKLTEDQLSSRRLKINLFNIKLSREHCIYQWERHIVMKLFKYSNIHSFVMKVLVKLLWGKISYYIVTEAFNPLCWTLDMIGSQTPLILDNPTEFRLWLVITIQLKICFIYKMGRLSVLKQTYLLT